MQTAEYLNYIATHFLELEETDKLKASRKGICFAKNDWASEKMPFFQLMKIIAFLLSILIALVVYSSSRIIFLLLESSGIIHCFSFLIRFSFWNYITWSNVISGAIGIILLYIAYKIIKRKIRKDLREIQNK